MSKNAQELLQSELVRAQEQLVNLDRQLQHRPDFELGEGSPQIIVWEMNLARRNVLMRRIEEIEQALERASVGVYGMCEFCGTGIDPERLRILPHTRRCVRCANIPKGSRPPAHAPQRATK